MIPKLIHYIWIGGKRKPKSLKLALESWHQYAHDYKVTEWNEGNIKEFDLPRVFFELLDKKQFAFASDVLRFHILQRYGGVYMDVDQILVAGIDDLLNREMFISKYHEVDDYYGFGLIGIVPGHSFARQMCDFYNKHNLDNFVVVNKIGSELVNANKKDITILEQEYFYPLSKKEFTKNTKSYHLANTSWIPWYKKILYKIPGYIHIKNFIRSILPKAVRDKIFKIEYL